MKKIIQLSVIIFLTNGVFFYTPPDLSSAENFFVIETGGKAFNIRYEELSKLDMSQSSRDFLNQIRSKLKPGMTLGFCEDSRSGKTRGIFTPPMIQIKVMKGLQVVISTDKMDIKTSSRKVKKELSSKGVLIDESSINIQTQLSKKKISKITSSKQMIALLRGIKKTVKISIRSIYGDLLKQEYIAEDISIKEFLKIMEENGFLTEERITAILELLTSKNIFLSERIDSVFEVFDQLGIFITISTQKLIEISEKIGIKLTLGSKIFQELVTKILISLDFSSKEIISLFRLINAESKLTSEQFDSIVNYLKHFFKISTLHVNKDMEADKIVYEISVIQAKLKLDQKVDKTVVMAEDKLKYTISYLNYGEEDASRILLIQVLPKGISYIKKKGKGNPELISLENDLRCLVWNLEKKVRSGSLLGYVSYSVRVDEFDTSLKRK